MNPTTRRPLQVAITLTVATPFNTAAAEPGAYGVDAPLLRDHRSRPLLPGSLVQGRIAEEIANWGAEYFSSLYERQGGKAEEGLRDQPNRKQLVIGDLIGQLVGNVVGATEDEGKRPNDTPSHLITRIALQPDTRSVERGALQVLESPAASGDQLCLTGIAHAFVGTEAEAELLRQELQTVLRLVPNVGAERSIGFGRVIAATVEVQAPDAAHAALRWPEGAGSADIELEFDRPIVVTDAPQSANGFDATDAIAGNVLKGVFADTCTALGLPLPPRLEAIVFRHAFCASGPARPRVNPASLVEADFGPDNPLMDLAAFDGPVLLRKGDAFSAPRFASDWKYDAMREAALDQHFGRAIPGRQLRVRTAIDSNTRAAEDNKLFAYEAMLHEHAVSEASQDPGNPSGTTWAPHAWRTRVDLSALSPEEQKQARATIVAVLQHGLYFLGKTKAIARVTAIKAVPAATLKEMGQTVLLTLQTPALLTSAQSLKSGSSAQDLFNAYSAYFENASEGGLTLSHFYARQKLRGGNYQRHRFQGGQKTYRPWVLTEAGAVFVLKVNTAKPAAKANQSLSRWLTLGLPPADGWSTNWQENPYQSANGFGEITIDQSCHRDWAPDKKGLTSQLIASRAAAVTPSV